MQAQQAANVDDQIERRLDEQVRKSWRCPANHARLLFAWSCPSSSRAWRLKPPKRLPLVVDSVNRPLGPRCSAQWEAERQRITERLARHRKADSAYLDLGVRLVDVAGRAAELYEEYGLLERRGFLASDPPGRHPEGRDRGR